MSEPTKSTVAIVARIIADTFVTSESDAQERAYGLVFVAEGWGGVGAAPQDWSLEIKNRYGEVLPWRSESDRMQFAKDRELTAKAYETYIRARK